MKEYDIAFIVLIVFAAIGYYKISDIEDKVDEANKLLKKIADKLNKQ